ncbi:hypothetical protein DFJ74DRAFT_669015 [Hyaloraphidium curvatum]|nr:hypothetical protein DFJ74DRAFT_669015 [Hyaloraphidium curvatum]
MSVGVAIPHGGFAAAQHGQHAAALPSPAASDLLLGLPALPTKVPQPDPAVAALPGPDRPRFDAGARRGDPGLDMLLHFHATSAITPPESPNDPPAHEMEWSPAEEPEERSEEAAMPTPRPQPRLLVKPARPSVDDRKDIDTGLLEYANLALSYNMSNKRHGAQPSPVVREPSAKKPRKGKPVRSLPPESSMKARSTASVASDRLSLSPSLQGLLGTGMRSDHPAAGGAWSTSSQVSADDSSNADLLAPPARFAYRERRPSGGSDLALPDSSVSEARSVSPEHWVGQRGGVPVAAELQLRQEPDGRQAFMPALPELLPALYVDPGNASDSDADDMVDDIRHKMDLTFTFSAVDDMIRRGEQSRLLLWNDEGYQRSLQARSESGRGGHAGYEDEPPSPVKRGRADSAPALPRDPSPKKPRVKKPSAPAIPRTTTKVFRSDVASLPPMPSTPKSKEPLPVQTPRVSYDIENVEIKRVRRSLPSETAGAPQYTWNKGDPIKYGPQDEYFDVLTRDEVKLCETIRLAPKLYLFVKDTMLSAREERGYFKKLEAKKWFRLDVNKTGKVYDWFMALGWILAGPE